jgi:MFS family permease
MFRADLGRGVPTINGVFLIYTLLFSGMEATLVFLAADRLQFTPVGNGALFVAMGVVAAAVQGGVFRAGVRRWGPRRLSLVGMMAMVPGFALLALIDHHPQPWLLWAGILLLAIGTGLVFPGLSTLASLAGDPARQGWVMGAYRSAGSLGRAFGPLLGALAYFAAPSIPYWICAGGLLLPLLLLARLPDTTPALPRS